MNKVFEDPTGLCTRQGDGASPDNAPGFLGRAWPLDSTPAPPYPLSGAAHFTPLSFCCLTDTLTNLVELL